MGGMYNGGYPVCGGCGGAAARQGGLCVHVGGIGGGQNVEKGGFQITGQAGVPQRCTEMVQIRLRARVATSKIFPDRTPHPPLQGARSMSSHCPPDAKCRLQRHL